MLGIRMKWKREISFFMVLVFGITVFGMDILPYFMTGGEKITKRAMAAGNGVMLLNEERMDSQGLYYRLYDNGTAAVSQNIEESVLPADGKIKIPERVQYNGEEWTISSAFIGGTSEKIKEISFSDCYMEVTYYGYPKVKKLCFGKNTKLKFDYFWGDIDHIQIDLGENVYYERINDGIYSIPHFNQNRILVYQEDTGREVVRVPDGTTLIAGSAFSHNSSVKKVILPDSCEEIGAGAFSNSALENIWLGNVKIIHASAFAGCSNLEGLVIQKDVALYSFWTGSNMKMFYMGGKWTSNNSNNSYSFSSGSLEYLLLGEVKQKCGQEGLTIKDLKALKGLSVPESTVQTMRTTLGETESTLLSSQKSCSHAYGNTEILYQDALQIVRGCVCRKCKHVKDVTVEKTADAYTESADGEKQKAALDSNFKDSQGITYRLDDLGLTAAAISFPAKDQIKLPDIVRFEGKSYTVIGAEASGGTTKILDTGSSCYYIGDYALDMMPLETLKLGKNMQVGSINNGGTVTWYGWGRLKDLKRVEVDAKNSYFTLDGNLLYSETKANLWQYIDKTYHTDYLTLPKWCSNIRANAFYRADVEGIDLDNVTSIRRGVFSESKLKSICRVSDTELSLWKEQEEFRGCTSLKAVFIKNLKLVSDSMFEGDASLEYVVFDGAVSRIRDSIFKDCTSLKVVYLSDKVNTILGNSFYNCRSLEKLYIPESVTKIDNSAFKGCRALTIYGKAGSYAQTYALNNNIPFQAVERSSIVYDQTITIEDAHASVKIPVSSACGHVNLSGIVMQVRGVVTTPAPVATSSPSSTPASSPAGSVTSVPADTKVPSSSPEAASSASNVPGVTKNPEMTKKPGGTKEPDVTKNPNATGSPGGAKDTMTPYPTKVPGIPDGAGNSTAAPDNTGQNTGTKSTESPKPSGNPSVAASPGVTKAPQDSGEKDGQSDREGDVPENGDSIFKRATLLVKNQTVMKISWKNLRDTNEYHIYRGTNKKKLKLYKKVLIPEEEMSQDMLVFEDKNISYMKIYYYQVKTPTGEEFRLLAGKATGLLKPKISVKMGRTGRIRFLTVYMKKYAGDSVQIYIKKNKGKYKRLKLRVTGIKKAKKKFKLALAVKNKTIFLKVRTYRKKRKGIYSAFSKKVAIKV